MENVTPCPNCNGKNLFRGPEVSAGGGQAPNYLAGLGGFFKAEKFVLVVCRDCGLARFFVRPQARAKLVRSKKWTRVY